MIIKAIMVVMISIIIATIVKIIMTITLFLILIIIMKMMIISDNINNDITIKDISLRQKSIIIDFC